MATVNADSKVNLLEQAQAARASSNWSLLIQCLLTLILGEQVSPASPDQPPVSESEPKQLFDLALGEKRHPRSQKTPPLEADELKQVLDLAIEAFVLGDFQERWDIAKVFPRLGQSAIAPLISILEDEDADEELRWYAARILGEFNHPAALAALVELLKTVESEELRAMAAAALGSIGSPAVASLTELLAQENTRLLAVRSLSHIRRSETIAPLLNVVQDPIIDIRVAAIEALSSFHDPRIPPVLLIALDDIAAPVRREAVIGLSFRADLQSELDLVNRLSPRLYDFNVEVCCSAAIALSRLGTDAAAAPLFQVLMSPHTPMKLQIEIIRSLSWLGTLTGLEYLRSCLQQSSVTVCQEIVTVLGRVEQPNLRGLAVEILIEMLQSDHPATEYPSVKQAIALSLSQLGDVRAIAPLIQLLADVDTGVRLHVITALKQLDSETAHRQLEQMAVASALAPDLKQGVQIALAEWQVAFSSPS